MSAFQCNRNSKNFKDKHKKSNSWEKIGKKFNLIGLFMNIFQIQNRCSLRFWSWRCRRFRTKRRNKFAAKFPPLCPPCCLLWFSREHNARVHLTFPLNEMYGYSLPCDRLRSSAIRDHGYLVAKSAWHLPFLLLLTCSYSVRLICDIYLRKTYSSWCTARAVDRWSNFA